MKNIKEEIVGLRGAFGSINNSLMFPIPFTYYHIVNTTVMTYLTILSWCFLYMSPGSQVITYDFMIFSGSHSQDLIFAKMMKLAVSNMIVHFLCAVCAVGLSFACFVHLFVSACVCSRAATGFLFLCIRSSASSFLDSKSWATTWRILLVSMMSTSTRRRLQTVTFGGVWKEEKRRDGREGDEGGSRGGTGRDGEGRRSGQEGGRKCGMRWRRGPALQCMSARHNNLGRYRCKSYGTDLVLGWRNAGIYNECKIICEQPEEPFLGISECTRTRTNAHAQAYAHIHFHMRAQLRASTDTPPHSHQGCHQPSSHSHQGCHQLIAA